MNLKVVGMVLALTLLLFTVDFFYINRTKLEHKMYSHISYITDDYKYNAYERSVSDCQMSILKYKNSVLNDSVITTLAEDCKVNPQLGRKWIFDKDLLDRNLGNLTCPEVKARFAETSGPYFALASFPGSGNSWTRLLLETITGIYTGSSYTDTLASFPGSKSSPCKTGVFIVKTHQRGERMKRCPSGYTFSGAIMILRNPFDAIVADFNRRKGGKVKVARKEVFESEGWSQYVKGMCDLWMKSVLYWTMDFDKPLHILVYEQLKENTMFEIYKVMQYLQLNVTLEKLYCLVKDSHELYYRSSRPDWLNKSILFSTEMKTLVNSKIDTVITKINRDVLDIEILDKYILQEE